MKPAAGHEPWAHPAQELTDQLGRQVRQAVELLVATLGQAHDDRGARFVDDIGGDEVYEAAVTVMMRLVFLLFAEERGLFLLRGGTDDALDEDAGGSGTGAWRRLLTTFRLVHGGVRHGEVHLPAYGGRLFDPDRFPILEGRGPAVVAGSGALPIDDRTVGHLLDALQNLTFIDRKGVRDVRRLSFHSLDVEQIGHVYEGLLDHTAVRVDEVTIGLGGRKHSEVALVHIETAADQGRDHLIDVLADLTGLSTIATAKILDAEPGHLDLERLTTACDGDPDLAARTAPYLGFVRRDLAARPMVHQPGGICVTTSADRRTSGTHYTPRALAEEVVRHTLEPLVYAPGPADGADPALKNLRSSREILDLKVCDMAMGSGAFLVATCRYLAERLVEAWAREGLGAGDTIPLARGSSVDGSVGAPVLMPVGARDRQYLARQLVADSCLYGVDRNPMAVEMAKLSMWLLTLDADRPFTFVDHALRCGDALLGITDLRVLERPDLDLATGLAPLRVAADAVIEKRWMAGDRFAPTPELRALHWPLEFPEVFADPVTGGFDAVVGNPPFLGNKYWKAVLGPSFQGMARHLLGGTPRKVDLAVLFHRRAYDLLAEGGCFGLLGPTQSAEGQAVDVGLGAIVSTGTIMRAVRGRPWPGDAKVRVNLVWVRRGSFAGRQVLNGVPVRGISSALAEGGERVEPTALTVPDLWAFEGVHNGQGSSFVLADTDDWFARLAHEGSPLLRPYVTGEDLGARPLTVNRRWVVDTGDTGLDEIRDRYPVVHGFLLEVVKPGRTPEALRPYKGLHDRWWQFWNTRAVLYRRLRERSSCIVFPKVAMYVLPTRAPTAWCYTNKVVVIEHTRPDAFGVLRSSAFGAWMTEYSTSFGVGGGISPSISKGANTFVLPGYSERVEALGDLWSARATAWCQDTGAGLTALQNAMHEEGSDGDPFRKMQTDLDEAVLTAYGWSDLDLDPGFHLGAHGQRFGPHPVARRRLIDRLLERNHDW